MEGLRTLVKHEGGRIAFLPWLNVPKVVDVGAFRFVPVELTEIGSVVGTIMADVVAATIRTHVDQSGKPIERCTLIVRPRSTIQWDMPDRRWPLATGAAKLLALGAMAEQRFLGSHVFHGHMNSTMFRPVNHVAMSASPYFSMLYSRRGGSLRVGGRKVTDTVFQQPYQIEGTRCDDVNMRLIKAVLHARRNFPELWSAIDTSLDMFLLGHSEAPELDDRTCIMLSAMAFERLLEPPQTSAQSLSKMLVELFSQFPSRPMSNSTWLRCDTKWKSEQSAWPIRQKWMKELYEARSAQAHRGVRPDLSSNFEPEKHLVISAFVFPLAIKLKLANCGLYSLSSDDLASCEVLDELIDSDWGSGFENPPKWPTILDTAQAIRGRREAITKAIRMVDL